MYQLKTTVNFMNETRYSHMFSKNYELWILSINFTHAYILRLINTVCWKLLS